MTIPEKDAILLNTIWAIITDDTKRSEDRINAIGTYLTWRDVIDPVRDEEGE